MVITKQVFIVGNLGQNLWLATWWGN